MLAQRNQYPVVVQCHKLALMLSAILGAMKCRVIIPIAMLIKDYLAKTGPRAALIPGNSRMV